MENLDAREYALNRIRNLQREFVWDPTCGPEWVDDLRIRLRGSIGLTTERVPLDAKTHEVTNLDGYRRETVAFSCREGMRAFGYLLVPDRVKEPAPAVVCVPGHGNGVDCIVGIEPDEYQFDFALQCVRAGIVVLAIEQISFGHRRSQHDSGLPYSCTPDSMAALMLGESMIGWRVHDALVALDYLGTRPEVDPTRMATMGISGGGLVAFWAACLDDRVSAAVVSGYFNTFLDSILSIDHCVDNFAPGLASIVEMPDMAALIAPRGLFVESGSEDPIFPKDAFLGACEKARQIYARFPERFGSHLFEGGHQFNGTQAIPQLVRWLDQM